MNVLLEELNEILPSTGNASRPTKASIISRATAYLREVMEEKDRNVSQSREMEEVNQRLQHDVAYWRAIAEKWRVKCAQLEEDRADKLIISHGCAVPYFAPAAQNGVTSSYVYANHAQTAQIMGTPSLASYGQYVPAVCPQSSTGSAFMMPPALTGNGWYTRDPQRKLEEGKESCPLRNSSPSEETSNSPQEVSSNKPEVKFFSSYEEEEGSSGETDGLSEELEEGDTSGKEEELVVRSLGENRSDTNNRQETLDKVRVRDTDAAETLLSLALGRVGHLKAPGTALASTPKHHLGEGFLPSYPWISDSDSDCSSISKAVAIRQLARARRRLAKQFRRCRK